MTDTSAAAAAAPTPGAAAAATPEAQAAAAAAASAAPTPEPAQGQPPVEQAKPELQIGEPEAETGDDTLPSAKQGDAFVYEPTGNDMLDYALSFVGNLGFGGDHPAIKAAGKGNWSLLEVELARLGPKAVGYDKIVSLAQKAIADEVAANDKAAADTRALAIKTFGGTEEQFDGMMTWITAQANEGKITAEERADLNRMLSRGGFQAQLAVQSIAAVYAKAGGNVVNPAKTSGETGASFGDAETKRWDTKSWSAFGREMRAKHGPNFERHPEYQRARQSALSQARIR